MSLSSRVPNSLLLSGGGPDWAFWEGSWCYVCKTVCAAMMCVGSDVIVAHHTYNALSAQVAFIVFFTIEFAWALHTAMTSLPGNIIAAWPCLGVSCMMGEHFPPAGPWRCAGNPGGWGTWEPYYPPSQCQSPVGCEVESGNPIAHLCSFPLCTPARSKLCLANSISWCLITLCWASLAFATLFKDSSGKRKVAMDSGDNHRPWQVAREWKLKGSRWLDGGWPQAVPLVDPPLHILSYGGP